jgi:hypothetical protein
MWCFRTGNGARRAVHGTSLVSVAWYTILRTSRTRCAQQNGPCWRSGSFGQNKSAPDLGGIGTDEAHIARQIPCFSHSIWRTGGYRGLFPARQ